MTVTFQPLLAGSITAVVTFDNLTVTVLAELTYALQDKPASIEVFGAHEQELPVVAPGTFMVNSEVFPPLMAGKLSVAVLTSPVSIIFRDVFGVKYKFVPSNSIAPASGVLRFVPFVNFRGAEPVDAVPALR